MRHEDDLKEEKDGILSLERDSIIFRAAFTANIIGFEYGVLGFEIVSSIWTVDSAPPKGPHELNMCTRKSDRRTRQKDTK